MSAAEDGGLLEEEQETVEKEQPVVVTGLERLAEGFDMVGGDAPAVFGDDETTSGHRIEVTGTRLLVMVEELSDYVMTRGGILTPTQKTADPDGPPMPGQTIEDLEEARIVQVGWGRYNQDTGEYAGSVYKAGDRVMFRRVRGGSHFVDEIPGRKDLLIIQEDVVRCRVHPKPVGEQASDNTETGIRDRGGAPGGHEAERDAEDGGVPGKTP